MKKSKNMKIGIDISQIVYEGTGVSRFTRGLTQAILDYDEENEWLFFFSALRRNLDVHLEERIVKNGHKLIKWLIPPTLLSFLWNDLHEFSKSYMLHVTGLNDLDWFITSDWTEPPLPVNKTTVAHDLVYLRYPETVDLKILTTQNRRLHWVKNESKIIFADSLATKQDLADLLHLDSKKIHVNYPGVEVKKPSKDKINLTLKKYNLTKPFILTVGKIEPRKNLARLIEAMKQLNNETIDLIIVGPQGWQTNNQQSTINNRRSNIKFLGLISDEELYGLYSACLFFIFPSIWEGFGYPVIEAMKLGAPVATSNTSSLFEIAEDAALLFNPSNVNEIYQCIDTLIHDKNLRDELSKKGIERSKIFTWENYYNRLIKTLYDYRN